MAEIKKSEDRFSITTRSGEVINLSKENVIKFLTDNVEITNGEFNMFFQMCKAYKVNPFLKEAYIVKYGSTPATIVMDYKVLQQIAEDNKAYRGMKHGVIVSKADGTVEERHGEYKLPNETLIAGWCEVYRSDRSEPTRVTAMFEEFKATKKSGEVNSNWATKPCFMICKVAKAQALREAFPNMFGSNIYVSEEMDCIDKPDKPTGKTNVTNVLVDDDAVVDTEVKEVENVTPKAEETSAN